MNVWTRLFRSRRVERELDDELRDHLERQVADYVSQGWPEPEARRRARLEFGGLDQVKELCRDVRGTRLVEEIVQDARHAVRLFAKARGFSAVAILTLALGIGANLAVFTLVDALLLRPLPVVKPQELVQLLRVQGAQSGGSFSYPQVRDLAEQSRLFSSLCAFGSGDLNIGPAEAVETISTAWVTGSYYQTLGVQALAGRLIGPDDDRPGAPPVVVIAERYWERMFGRATSAIGQSIIAEGVPITIVGVTRRAFAGAVVGDAPDLTVPINARAQLLPERAFLGPSARWLRVLARPRAGVTHDELKAGLGVFWTQRITASLSPNLPADQRARALASSIDLRPAATGTSDLRTEFRQPLLVTMALVTLVLLIACVNVANLLLARATVRQREMAMRLAIGASRGRLLRQLLTESLLLTAAGAGLGVLLGSAGSHILLGLMSGISSGPDSSGGIVLDLAFNWRMFTYTVLLAGATTMLFGTLPALRASRLEPALAMTASSTRIAEPRRWIAGVLVTAQVAVSLLLLVGAGLFTRTLQNLRSLDLGFKHDDLLVAEIDATRAVLSRLGPDGRVSKAEALRAFNQEVFDFTRRLPGVRAATTSAVTPLQGGGISQAITVNDQPVAEEVYFNFVSQDFFAVLHTPVAMGREFTAADVATDSPRVAIVNETFVRRYLPPGNPLDQRVTHGKSETLQIVGVVKDAVYDSLRDAVPPTMYVPFTQRESGMSIIVSAPGALAAVATAIRSELQPKLAGRPVRLRTLTTQFESNLVRERMMASVAGAFGVLALVLAAVGLYGLLAYWVTRRTHEIGIRLALGAGPLRVRQHVLGDAVRMLASGTIIGIPLAWAFAHSLSSLLFGLTPADTGTFAGAVAVLTITGLLAAWIPARRASAVNPIAALRVE